jgi:hypothetical protein
MLRPQGYVKPVQTPWRRNRKGPEPKVTEPQDSLHSFDKSYLFFANRSVAFLRRPASDLGKSGEKGGRQQKKGIFRQPWKQFNRRKGIYTWQRQSKKNGGTRKKKKRDGWRERNRAGPRKGAGEARRTAARPFFF